MLTLVALFLLVLVYWCLAEQRQRRRRPRTSGVATSTLKGLQQLPGPRPWPIIGSLHLLGKHETPFQAFTALSKIYGDVFAITLGTTKCVVVNNFNLIKEVLITKGADCGGRPDLLRFHKLFGGDRNNSLALCDWSSLQKTRRSIARMYCSPRFTSLQYDVVSDVGAHAATTFLAEVRKCDLTQPCDLKPLVLTACANMFTQYMCSTSFDYDDPVFRKVVHTFDEIFWEINQGYAVDFLPWLQPLYESHMKRISSWASDVRQFILAQIIEERRVSLDKDSPPRDFTDALLLHLEEDPNMNWQHIIFELEDFLGGHSAVGNLVMVTLANIVQNSHVAERIHEEIETVIGNRRMPNLFDKAHMPYTEATILETLRVASSPIVPHAATEDTEIGGYQIEKGTVIFINNYELNVGNEYWDEPEKFKPERFILSTGQIQKPAHFIPFSTGKRTCIGQRLVYSFGFILLVSLIQNFNIHRAGTIKLKPGCVATPPHCFKLLLHPRDELSA